MAKQFFIAGTDTGIGKTHVVEVLLRHAAASGRQALGLKPVAAGAELNAEGELVNEDALRLIAAANVSAPYAVVNPCCLPQPVSPHLAARYQGTSLTVDALLEGMQAGLSLASDLTLIEGAGGWRVPLNDSETMADFARALGLPVVLVVGIRLGCLNHAKLTLEAMRADGVEVAGWIANDVDANMLAREDNVSSLRERLDLPLLARVAYCQADADYAGSDLGKDVGNTKQVLQSLQIGEGFDILL